MFKLQLRDSAHLLWLPVFWALGSLVETLFFVRASVFGRAPLRDTKRRHQAETAPSHLVSPPPQPHHPSPNGVAVAVLCLRAVIR